MKRRKTVIIVVACIFVILIVFAAGILAGFFEFERILFKNDSNEPDNDNLSNYTVVINNIRTDNRSVYAKITILSSTVGEYWNISCSLNPNETRTFQRDFPEGRCSMILKYYNDENSERPRMTSDGRYNVSKENDKLVINLFNNGISISG